MRTEPSKSNIIIRPMRRGDAVGVVLKLKKLQAFHGDVLRVDAKDFLEYCFGVKRLAKAWVITNRTVPIGFAVARDWMNFAQAVTVRTVDLLYVEDEFRGQGLGTHLLAHLADDAYRKGIRRLDISANKKNRGANKLYKTLGLTKRVAYCHDYKIEHAALKKLANWKQS